jgi:hypothetical protein
MARISNFNGTFIDLENVKDIERAERYGSYANAKNYGIKFIFKSNAWRIVWYYNKNTRDNDFKRIVYR